MSKAVLKACLYVKRGTISSQDDVWERSVDCIFNVRDVRKAVDQTHCNPSQMSTPPMEPTHYILFHRSSSTESVVLIHERADDDSAFNRRWSLTFQSIWSACTLILYLRQTPSPAIQASIVGEISQPQDDRLLVLRWQTQFNQTPQPYNNSWEEAALCGPPTRSRLQIFDFQRNVSSYETSSAKSLHSLPVRFKLMRSCLLSDTTIHALAYRSAVHRHGVPRWENASWSRVEPGGAGGNNNGGVQMVGTYNAVVFRWWCRRVLEEWLEKEWAFGVEGDFVSCVVGAGSQQVVAARNWH